MKTFKLFLASSLIVLLSSCSKEVVSVKDYSATILDNSVYDNISQLQSANQVELFKRNRIKSMSFVLQKSDSQELDSLTYLEFDEHGRLIRRTTKDVTTVGCVSFMLRQDFYYSDNILRKVNNSSFKYEMDYTLDYWMLIDTSMLKMFDWEDYTYNGDTTIVESGFAIWKYVTDANYNITNHQLHIKTTKQTADVFYKFTPHGLTEEIKPSNYSEPELMEYTITGNKVRVHSANAPDDVFEESIYNETGLLISRVRYKNQQQTSRTIISYSYY